jgi:hypothetical protein
MTPALGWRGKAAEDLRWLNQTQSSLADLPRLGGAGENIPESIDHEWLELPEQHSMGSCRGHSGAVGATVCNWIDTGGEVLPLSRMYVYLTSQQADGLVGDVGATIAGGIKAMSERGVPREETFPYPGQYSTHIPPAADAEAREHRILKHAPMRSYDDCFRWLATGVGVLDFGILWTQELADNTSGVLDRDRGRVLGGHAVLSFGYSRRVDRQDRKYLWFGNWHGPQWGKNGRAEVAPALIDKWCRSPDCEVRGVSDLEEYSVRPVDFRGMYTGR